MSEDANGTVVPRPEIIIGLVGAVGSDLDTVAELTEVSLSRFGYKSHRVRISSKFSELFSGSVQPEGEDNRIDEGMAQGTTLRKRVGRGDAAIGLALQAITELRDSEIPGSGIAYIIRSLKHPDEVEQLRAIYKHHFVCIGVFSPRNTRVTTLAQQIADSHGQRTRDWRSRAEALVQRDEKELGTKLGQDVRGTFPLADFFVNSSDSNGLALSIDRLWDLVFGRPFLSPTREEFGMFQASAAALRSAALARQVGAAICTADGDILAVGMNEVPKAGGGHYWCDDPGDKRDFKRGYDQNDRTKRAAAREVVIHLREKGWLADSYAQLSIEDLLKLATEGEEQLLRDTIFGGLTEFGREVHAEMSAITTAARLGTCVRHALMYVTTFPCHNCAKHIIASGLSGVVYIEPYPKSFAAEFHDDSMTLDGDADGSVGFRAFQGVAPHRHIEWFQWGSRKKGGKAVGWQPIRAAPRFTHLNFEPSYREREDAYLREFLRKLKATEPSAG